MSSPNRHTSRLLPWLAIVLAAVSDVSGQHPDQGTTPRDAVTFRMPDDPAVRSRLGRAAGWLKRHLVSISAPGQDCRLHLIAWKDPTLEPADPKLLAGYVITDTLWAARALKLFEPAASEEIRQSLECLRWSGNGLHEVLFHPVEKILHRPADDDITHGSSLGRFPTTDGFTVDVRGFHQQWDAKFDAGHPRLFAEHAVYHALFDAWQGRTAEARQRILKVITEDQNGAIPDPIFWDRRARILVDFVNHQDWLAFHNGQRPMCRHYTFKLGLLLYAIRLVGLEEEVGASTLSAMEERLWSAQTESGGLAHFVDVRGDGASTMGRQPTGEASAIAILAALVEPKARGSR